MFNPYPNLPYKIRDYVLTSLIGKGGFAFVYKATHTTYNVDFAIKIVCKSSISEKNIITYNAEINSLSKLDHPNVIKLYDFFIEEENMFIVLEYCSGGTLEEKISKNELISHETKVSICTQIISGLKYCYDMSIAHLDIKTANILFDDNGRVKIADFGLSEFILHENNTNQHKGTLSYSAPEVCQKGFFNPYKSDIWSIGVLFYRLFTYTYPFEGINKEALKKAIIYGYYNEKLPVKLINPVRMMVLVNPDERITIHKLAKMKIFALPKFKDDIIFIPKILPFYSLNVKLGKKRASLLYNQKFPENKKVRRHHSFQKIILPPL